MEKREMEVLWNFYYGIGQVEMIWIDDVIKLVNDNFIRKIYEITDNDFSEKWYLIRTKAEKSFIIKSKYKNKYAVDIMKEFKNKYKFYEITTDVIKMYDNNIFPIVYKVYTDNYYDFEENINKAFFNNFYFEKDKKFHAIKEYRNKVKHEIFDKEEDAIYWCSCYELSKDEILINNIRPLNLENIVYDYTLKGGFKND